MNLMYVTIAIFVLMIISFALNKIPMALTSVMGMILLVIFKCVEPSKALSNFGSSTVVTMVSMFIIAAGLQKTAMIDKLSGLVYRVSGGSFRKVLGGYVIVTFILAQFIPTTTAVFALVCPLVMTMCRKMKVSPSRMLYSIALVTVATAWTFSGIGPYASNFIEDNGYLAEYGITGYDFTIFTEMWVKIPVSAFAIIWAIFAAPKLTPDNGCIPEEEDIAAGGEKRNAPGLLPFQEFLGYGVFAAVIISLMCGSFGLDNWIIPMAGACILVLTGVLSPKEAVGSMGMEIILLYVGVVTLGNAFAATGAGEMLGGLVEQLLGGTRNSYIIGGVFFAAAFIMTTLLYNRAVSKILIPIILLFSSSTGCDPRGIMCMCYVGSMCSLLTPMATSVVPMMMAKAGYTQKDLIKMGWIPSLIMGIIAVGVGMTLFPCF